MYYLIEDGHKIGGKFEIIKTSKGFKIEMIEKPDFMLGASEMAFSNKTKTVSFSEGKKTSHAVRKLDNDEYLIYFYQSGVPCWFKRIEKEV